MTAADLGREEDAHLKNGIQNVPTTTYGIYPIQKQGKKAEKKRKKNKSENQTVSGAMTDLWPVGN